MKFDNILLFAFLAINSIACGQTATQQTETKTIQQNNTMDTSKLTNQNVKNAFEALQNGDKIWYSYFTENPTMTDDGNKVDFKSFFGKALGTEKFLTIDKVENEGKDIYGNFKAGQWGTFPVYFKFHENADG